MDTIDFGNGNLGLSGVCGEDEGIILRDGPYDGRTFRVPKGIPYWFVHEPMNSTPVMYSPSPGSPIPEVGRTLRYNRTQSVYTASEFHPLAPPKEWTVFSFDWSW